MVHFTSTATGKGISHSWNFGDGTTSNEVHPDHVFTASGSFEVTHEVTDKFGRKTFTSKTVAVTQPVFLHGTGRNVDPDMYMTSVVELERDAPFVKLARIRL